MPKQSSGFAEENQSTGNGKTSVFQYLQKRQTILGESLMRSSSFVSAITTRSVPLVVREHEISLGGCDKVFASKWLDERRIVCGTKCNKVGTCYLLSSKGSFKSNN